LTLLLAIIISHRYIRLALNLSRVVSCLDRISADVLVLEVWDRQPILAIFPDPRWSLGGRGSPCRSCTT
ncbi:hypothetical protein PFISCL1PPCAC_28902, partial [Pristionchus fissidentatus]